jgi:hypothetical protein
MSSKDVTHHRWSDIPLENLSPLLDRKLITGDGLMIAQVFLKKGAVVPRHQHHNEQLTYIVEGALRFYLGEDESRIQDVRAGEVLHIRRLPGTRPRREDTLDVDVFNPPREDWLNKTDDYLQPEQQAQPERLAGAGDPVTVAVTDRLIARPLRPAPAPLLRSSRAPAPLLRSPAPAPVMRMPDATRAPRHRPRPAAHPTSLGSVKIGAGDPRLPNGADSDPRRSR